MPHLTFRELQAAAVQRHAAHPPEGFGTANLWDIRDIVLASLGEWGETANVVKKIRRGDFSIEASQARTKLAEEIGGTLCYFAILAAEAELDLGEIMAYEFNRVSRKLGFTMRLPEEEYCECGGPPCQTPPGFGCRRRPRLEAMLEAEAPERVLAKYEEQTIHKKAITETSEMKLNVKGFLGKGPQRTKPCLCMSPKVCDYKLNPKLLPEDQYCRFGMGINEC